MITLRLVAWKIRDIAQTEYRKNKGHEFDIVHGESFIKSHRYFGKVCEELKQKGYGIRESYKEIISWGKSIFNNFIRYN